MKEKILISALCWIAEQLVKDHNVTVFVHDVRNEAIPKSFSWKAPFFNGVMGEHFDSVHLAPLHEPSPSEV